MNSLEEKFKLEKELAEAKAHVLELETKIALIQMIPEDFESVIGKFYELKNPSYGQICLLKVLGVLNEKKQLFNSVMADFQDTRIGYIYSSINYSPVDYSTVKDKYEEISEEKFNKYIKEYNEIFKKKLNSD